MHVCNEVDTVTGYTHNDS